MAPYGEMPGPLINKLSGLVFILLGFLLATADTDMGMPGTLPEGLSFLPWAWSSWCARSSGAIKATSADGDEGA
jgi:hypothetical protein